MAYLPASMHIALLTDGLYPYTVGGIQRHSRMLGEHLAQLGIQLTVFHTAHEPAIRAARALEGLNTKPWQFIRTEFVEYPSRGWYPGHYIEDCRRYSEALLDRYEASAISPDFIYAQGLTGIAFTKARRHGSLRVPVGVNLHGYEMFQTAFGIRGRLEQQMIRPAVRHLTADADYVISFPGRIREIVEGRLGVPASRVLCLPNAVDPLWIKKSPTDSNDSRRRFIFVGRAERRKGLPELHKAISSIPTHLAEFHFVGPIAQSSQLNQSNVFYHGVVTDVPALTLRFDACDILVCPSYAEGMPTVILEAMARGLAILTTDVGAVGEIVDASNGVILASPKVSHLRAAIIELARLPPHDLAAMKAASLAKAPAYGWDNVARATVDTIQAAITRAEAP